MGASTCHYMILNLFVIRIQICKIYLESVQTIKIVSPKITFTVLFLTIYNRLYFLERLSNTFEITLSCSLGEAYLPMWNVENVHSTC